MRVNTGSVVCARLSLVPADLAGPLGDSGLLTSEVTGRETDTLG